MNIVPLQTPIVPPPAPTASPVEFMRPEVAERLSQWQRIRAACDGEDAVKSLGDIILPRPNAEDISASNQARYLGYVKRAVWYNVSARTLNGLTGYVFQKEPVVTLPATLKPIEENIDGTGLTLNQQAKAALRMVLSLGRGGLLVDYPPTSSPTTRQQQLDGNVGPTIVLYDPEQIINWRTTVNGAKVTLVLLVLRETYAEQDMNQPNDEFRSIGRVQFRVLTAANGIVKGRIFRKPLNTDRFEEDATLAYEPKDNSGKNLSEIPFTFIGAENNDPDVDTPPLLDLVNLNFAHYRNSADHEESCYIVGQPTPWVSGLTESWVTEVWKGPLHLGSRAVIPLPANGSAGLLQASPNTLPFEAMKHKEMQMIALGAKLVEQTAIQQTATEAEIHHASEVSTLTSAATNVFLAYKLALALAGKFVGENGTIEFELTEPLTTMKLDGPQATALMAIWMGGLIDFEEARWQLMKAGIAWKDDAQVQAANAADQLRQPPAVDANGNPIPPGNPPPPNNPLPPGK